ncbi:hypothetical protein A4S05_17825 [Nostoc sp. KVJ20]|nr:hypothetical protein A4S05_17825 [Nostoc sp. KVJ20]
MAHFFVSFGKVAAKLPAKAFFSRCYRLWSAMLTAVNYAQSFFPERIQQERQAEGRRQEAGGILPPVLCRDRSELGFESPTEISDSVPLLKVGV